MHIRRQVLASFILALFTCSLLAQAAQTTSQTPSQPSCQASQRTDADREAYRTAMEEADQKIADEVKAHSELMKNLEYLTTQIGARLTGSPQMQAASDWTLKRFKDYGVDAHLETTNIARSWTRGLETAEITSPIQKRIGIHAFGWSKGTSGDVSGQVVMLDVEKLSDMDQYHGKLKGKIVRWRKPADMSKLDPDPENAYDAVIAPRRGVPKPGINRRDGLKIFKRIAEEGPALSVGDSG